jgi:hypothetical protein
VPTDEEVEATRRKSEEILAESKRLLAQVESTSGESDRLQANWDREVARMSELLKVKGTKQGTGVACLMATLEAIGDYADVELSIAEGLRSTQDSGSKPADAPVRPGPRRGLRI